MMEHKWRAVVVLVSRSGKPLEDFIAAASAVAEKLEEAYGHDLSDEWKGESNRERFVEMMVMDGCFMLELLAIQDDCDKPFHSDYDMHDPIFSRRSMWPVIRSDMLALENQLPLLLLQKLMSVQESKTTPEGIAEVDKIINHRVLKFLRAPLHQDAASSSCEKRKELLERVMDNMKLGHHPLELYHRSLIYSVPQTYRAYKVGGRLSEYQKDIMPSAVEMHGAGIKFRTSTTNSLIDVHFKATKLRWNRVLTMPQVTVDDSTEYLFLNLMAFERLHCRVNTHVTAYVIFMDNLIESPIDVAMLCSKGVLKNMLGSNQQLAHLFNGTLAKGALMEKYSEVDESKEAQSYTSTVQARVKNHCKIVGYKWRAILARRYFGNPWTLISLVAAVILLVATLVQTFYTVVPYYKPRD
uniref:Uncharacterized protein n=1 Tax=Avena sativa TaxID=4498 RepID=A0ACD5Y964_AVESA